MEQWREVFKEKIPKGIYSLNIQAGEEHGLIIELLDTEKVVACLDFGFIQAFRVFDEGLVQSNLYAEEQVKKFSKDNFKNIIYEITNGQFDEEVNSISLEYSRVLELKHYVLVTQNYNVDIIASGEPVLEMFSTGILDEQ